MHNACMNDKLVCNYLGVLATGLSDAIIAGSELSATAQAILLTLRHWAPMPAAEISSIIRVSQPATARALDRLRAQSLIIWAEQGRTRPVSLTTQGRDVAASLEKSRYRLLAHTLSPLSAAESRQLARLLEKLLAGPERDRAEARYTCRFCDHRVCDGEQCPVGRSVDSAQQVFR